MSASILLGIGLFVMDLYGLKDFKVRPDKNTGVLQLAALRFYQRFILAIDDRVGIFIGHTSTQASDLEQPDAKCLS